MSANHSVPHVRVFLYGVTDVGVVRSNNEDAFQIAELSSGKSGLSPDLTSHAVTERGTLLMVADGMGGAEAGEVASQMVVEQFVAELASAPLDQPVEDVTRDAVERTNMVVWRAAQENEARRGMGATLAAAWIRGTEAIVTGVGDSRVYLLRAGKMRQITRDQSMVESLVETGQIDRTQADHHPQRNVILQAMGVSANVVVPIERVNLRRGDFLLLCSDGLSGKLSAEEMRDCILTTQDLQHACGRMVTLAKQRGGEDNITVVVAELDGDDLPETTLNERMTRTLQSISGFDFKTGTGYAVPPPAPPTHSLGSESPSSDPPKEDGSDDDESPFPMTSDLRFTEDLPPSTRPAQPEPPPPPAPPSPPDPPRRQAPTAIMGSGRLNDSADKDES